MRHFLIILFALVFSACNDTSKKTTEVELPTKADAFELLNTISGKWATAPAEMVFHEQWVKKDDSTYIGVGFYTQSGKTLFSEKLSIERQGNSIYYIPVISSNKEPVKFRLTAYTENEFTFENLEHDFPTHIIYKKLSDDRLTATVKGLQNGLEKKEAFEMSRVE